MSTLPLSRPALRSRVPLPGGAVVRRRRLLELLDAPNDPRAVTLLTAPAGSGKTTLLVDWIVSRRLLHPGPVAWLTVDEPDNDLETLRSCLVSTFAQAGSASLAAAVTALPTPDDPASSDFTALLVDALESVDEQITLILDDGHLLHEPDALAVLGDFLRWPPGNVRIIVAGRFEPPLALRKLRLDGRVRDIAAGAIAFTAAEASEMLTRAGTSLGEHDLAELMARTEGWAAGLRLACMTLAGSERPSEAIAAFTGSAHNVADYLVGELLSHLPEHVRRFLIETSVPEHFTTALAERLTGDPHAQDIIDYLCAHSFPLERLPEPGPSYRYHPLMREYLRAEIARLGAEQIRTLERVASSWFNHFHQPLQALQHSAHAGDTESIVAILTESGVAMVLNGDAAPVLAAVEECPNEARHAPITQLVTAAALLAEGNHVPAVSILAASRRTAPSSDPADLDAEVLRHTLQVHACIHTGNIGGAATRLMSLDIGHTGSPALDSYASMMAGIAQLHLGHTTHAARLFADAAANARAGNLHRTTVSALALRAATLTLAAQLEHASTVVDECRRYAVDHGLVGDAVVALAESVELLVGWMHTTSTSVLDPESVWAAIAHTGDPAMNDYALRIRRALQGSGDARGRDHEGLVVPGLDGLLAPTIQLGYLASGDLRRAADMVESTARRLGRVGEVSLLTAEIHRVHGRLDAADAELSAILDGSRRCTSPLTPIRGLLASACAASRRKNPTRAFEQVVRALTLAEPESILLPFAEARPEIRDILTHNHGRFGAIEAFADLARSAVPNTGRITDRSGTGALTRRELELLRELPSWRTAEQIAADHFVSVNTVKTHLRGIYRKLEVRSRRDAIAAAHEQGLL